MVVASVRLEAPSLAMTLLTCVFTVDRLITSRSAMSALEGAEGLARRKRPDRMHQAEWTRPRI
jgi:hypothetical protein